VRYGGPNDVASEKLFNQSANEFVPGYEMTARYGSCAPRKMPAKLVDQLNNVMNAGLASAEMKARIADLRGTPPLGSPADFGKHFNVWLVPRLRASCQIRTISGPCSVQQGSGQCRA
jgi:hypothetical protein